MAKPERSSCPGVRHRDGAFLVDDQPQFLFSGEMHMFRVLPEQWADRLLKMRRCYLNTLGAYLAWNWHEPEPGRFDFSGAKDVDQFLALAEMAGLRIFVRPGPFICAEWDYGGLPTWLMAQQCEVRTTEDNYLGYVRRWYQAVNTILRRHQHGQGGGIVLYQVENEDWWSDVPYALSLLAMVREDGIEVPVTVNENPGVRGTEIIDTLDDYPLPWNPDSPYMFVPEGVEHKLKKLHRTQPDKPMMYAEFECGWFTIFGDDLPSCRLGEVSPAWTDVLTKTVIGMGVNAINNYMFCGGTNFAYNQARPNTSSHDWMAPVGEWGQLTPTYYALRRIGAFLEALGPQLAVCPPCHDLTEGDGQEITLFYRIGERSAFLFPRNIGPSQFDTRLQVALPGTGESLCFPRHGAFHLPAHSAAIVPVNVQPSPGGPGLLYTTSQFFGAFPTEGELFLLFYERPGSSAEVMLQFPSFDEGATITGPAHCEWLDGGRLCLNYTQENATQVVRIDARLPVTLLLTTPTRAGRTWEAPVEAGTLPFVSNIYLLRTAAMADGRLVAELDVEPDAAVEVEFPWSGIPRAVRLDGCDIPASYLEGSGLVRFGWQEDPVPDAHQDLAGPWKRRPDALPKYGCPGDTSSDCDWQAYSPWASAEDCGFYHNGYLWYATSFDPPAPGGPLHLLLTRFQDDATVYVNGQFAGSGNQHLSLEIARLVEPGAANRLHICIEVQGRDSWVAGDDRCGLIGPVILYREREMLPLPVWKRREMPRSEEFLLQTAPPQALPDYDDGEWDDCLVQDGWDSQIHGRWRAKHFLWYRTRIQIPAAWHDKRVWMEVGRAQDTTWVYVDGQLAGRMTMFRRQGRGEFGVDLTSYVRPGQEVVLACCVLGKWVGRKGFYRYVRLCAADDLLASPWLIRSQLEGQRRGFPEPGHEDGDWTEVALPGSLVAEEPAGGVWWFRKGFVWDPPSDWELPLGLVLKGLDCKALIYLNGHLVGRYRPAGPQTTFHLPAPLLGRENLLALAVDTEGRPCRLEAVSLAPQFPVRRRRLEIDLQPA
jgi:hypothetical protein